MLIGRRFGRPGLIGTVARTAVITGTAAMTAGAISHHQQQKYAAQQQAEALDQDAAQPVPTTASVDPLVERINQLAALHASGVLTDSEFSEAKAKLLAG
jgi:hypothetical protein